MADRMHLVPVVPSGESTCAFKEKEITVAGSSLTSRIDNRFPVGA